MHDMFLSITDRENDSVVSMNSNQLMELNDFIFYVVNLYSEFERVSADVNTYKGSQSSSCVYQTAWRQ